MYITWLGQSCFRIEEKVNNANVTVITDPYNESVGLRVPKYKADIATVSHYHEDHGNTGAVSGMEEKARPIIFDRPGEYETRGVFINGIGSYHDKKEGAEFGKSTMFRFDIDGITILHMGDIGTALSDNQLEKIGDIDILLIPVGGKYTLNAAEAAEVARQIEPRVVIPMHYKIEGVKMDIDSVEKFKKEMGGNAETAVKFKISKKDLPQEEIKLVILEKD